VRLPRYDDDVSTLTITVEVQGHLRMAADMDEAFGRRLA
jgi:hypothetical protein